MRLAKRRNNFKSRLLRSDKSELAMTIFTDNYSLITKDELFPVLTKAIQEQQEQIEQLKSIVCLDHPETDICT